MTSATRNGGRRVPLSAVAVAAALLLAPTPAISSEGGLVLIASTYEWREVDVYRDIDRGVLNERGFPERGIVNDRVVVGPRPYRVTPENLREVRIQPYLSGVSLELVLAGEPEPIFLPMAAADAAKAEKRDVGMRWVTDLDEAIAEAKDRNIPLFVAVHKDN